MMILGTQVPLWRNLRTVLCCYPLLWVFFLLTVALDLLSTVRFMTLGGVHLEANVLVFWLATTLGVWPGVALAKLLQVLAAAAFSALSLRLGPAVLLFLTVLNLLAFLVNMH